MNISATISDTIQSGLSVSKKLFALAEKIRPANTEVNKLATDIILLTSTLNSLRTTLSSSDGCRYSIGAVELAQKVLDRCREIFEGLDKVLVSLKLEGVRKEDLVLKTTNEFQRTESKILRVLLEACSITLHLMLHNLTISKKPIAKRSSMYTLDMEAEQHELIIHTLQTSRQNTIAFIEHLENGDTNKNILSSSKSNKLRKLKRPNKEKETKESNIRKERASDWVRSLIRDERNNALIALEFSPQTRKNSEGFEGIEERKLNGGDREVRAGVGELQGDGPNDLPSRSERMEYARGWPSM
ncbi:hypothetical protein DL98DRAFT_652243 [Cadophora sp. DSE1049]|nr:hypothetical protein DL98DRAFT_652243 [Cadophora sp. DSE1049]